MASNCRTWVSATGNPSWFRNSESFFVRLELQSSLCAGGYMDSGDGTGKTLSQLFEPRRDPLVRAMTAAGRTEDAVHAIERELESILREFISGARLPSQVTAVATHLIDLIKLFVETSVTATQAEFGRGQAFSPAKRRKQLGRETGSGWGWSSLSWRQSPLSCSSTTTKSCRSSYWRRH